MSDGRKYYESVKEDLNKLNDCEKATIMYKLLGWFGRDEWFQEKFTDFLKETLEDKEEHGGDSK
jgi:hypothetical protein